MNRNVESHFALNPTRIDMSRSTFDRSASVKTSFNVGDIVPFFLEEVLPGDTTAEILYRKRLHTILARSAKKKRSLAQGRDSLRFLYKK